MAKTDQIFYSNYSAKLKPEHKNYWSDIGDIAYLISLHLESYSTIRTTDHKEKFGTARVYTYFGDFDKVLEKYGKDFKKLYKITDKLPDDFEAFTEKCVKEDYKHYRHTYLMFKRLFPHYWHSLWGGADYQAILYDTKEDYLGNRDINVQHKEKHEIYQICGWSD